MPPQEDAPASDEKEPADIEKGKRGRGDPEVKTASEGPKHITFQQPKGDDEVPNCRTSGERERRRSRSRSRHSFNSARGGAGGNPLTGIPIEFHALSIQISESRNITTEVVKGDSCRASVHTDKEYFERFGFNLLPRERLCQQFNVSSEQGLSAEAAGA